MFRVPNLDGCLAKLEHADEFIGQLKASTSGKYAKAARLEKEDSLDPGRRKLKVIVRVAEVPEIPTRWSLLVGDAAHNMRGALDYLAYELVGFNNGGTYDERTQFPISHTPDEKGHGRLGWRTITLLGAHWSIIEKAQPYHDPTNIYAASLGLLKDISNTDKHRLLVPVSIAADVGASHLVSAGTGISRLERAHYHSGVIGPGDVLATEEFLAITDEPVTTLTPWYQPAVCFAEWPTIPAHDSLAAIHRRIEDLVAHFVVLFSVSG